MSIELRKTAESPLRFSIRTTDGRPFALTSFLIVDAAGEPLWEFVRNDFEPCEMEDGFELSAVLTDEFRALLQEVETARPKPKADTLARYVVTYGAVPTGYRPSIPERGDAPALRAGQYRAVAFSSEGSASEVFRYS